MTSGRPTLYCSMSAEGSYYIYIGTRTSQCLMCVHLERTLRDGLSLLEILWLRSQTAGSGVRLQRPLLASALQWPEPGADPPRDVAISGIVLFALVSHRFGAAIAISSTIAYSYKKMWYCGDVRPQGRVPSFLYGWLRSGSCVLRVLDSWGLYESWRLSVYGMYVWRRSLCAWHFCQCQEWSGHLVLEDCPLLFLDYPWTKGCGEKFLSESLWVLFGRGTLGRNVWMLDIGISPLVEIWCLLVFFFFLHFVWCCGCCHYIFECWSFLSFASFVFYCCFLAWWILLSASWMFCSLLFFYFALWLCGFCYRIFENVDAFWVLFSFCFFYLHFGFPWILASEFEPKLLEFSFLLCLTCIFALLALIFYNFD